MPRKKQHNREGMNRTQRIYVRVNEEEKQLVETVATRMNMTISRTTLELYRQAYDEQEHIEEQNNSPQVKKLEAIRTQLWHIGHNVNQIARQVNRNAQATIMDEHSAARAVIECGKLLKQIDHIIQHGA